MATKINLRDFYPWYTQDEFIEVTDEVATELLAAKRYQKTHERQMYRYKAQYSLDVENGIEAAAIVHSTNNPEAILEIKERFCRLCRALNSLPEIQGRRVEAHFLLNMSRKDIAESEGVSESAVNAAIDKGLAAMKKYLKNDHGGGCYLPENCQC